MDQDRATDDRFEPLIAVFLSEHGDRPLDDQAEAEATAMRLIDEAYAGGDRAFREFVEYADPGMEMRRRIAAELVDAVRAKAS